MAPPPIDELVLFAFLNIVSVIIARRRRRRSVIRTIWVKPWLRRREHNGAHGMLLQELKNEDTLAYNNYLRIHPALFEDLKKKIEPLVSGQDTKLRKAISVEEKLSVTLRFLATGETYQSLQYQYRISKSALSCIIPEVCKAIYTVLKDEYMKVPSTEEEWKSIAKDFEEKWNFPHCVGALDGKHVVIRPPKNSGSYYFNYKHTFSIVLLALVDANYKFTFVDVGCNGRISDGGVLRNSTLNHCLENNILNIPGPEPLPSREVDSTYVVIGDEAFPLKPYLMKPYSARELTLERRVYNYRLSRARRVVENAFGILASRFRIFYSPICLKVETVETIVLATVALHNMLMENNKQEDNNMNLSDPVECEANDENVRQTRQDRQSQAFQSLDQQGSNMYSNTAAMQREEFCDFFNTEGQVPWQWKSAL